MSTVTESANFITENTVLNLEEQAKFFMSNKMSKRAQKYFLEKMGRTVMSNLFDACLLP